MTRKKSNAGGSAMAGGARFQARVSAWYCARILLQTPAIGQDFDLPATSIAERIYCETKDITDDLCVELTGNGKIYGQCKTSLSLSSTTESEWASVLIQFYKELEKTVAGVERRFVLFYENTNGNLEKLSKFLKRYRQLPTGSPLIDAAYNTDEENISKDLDNLLQTLHSEDAKTNNPELQNLVNSKEVLLRHTYIKQLRLGENESDYFGVVDALQYGLLTNSDQILQVIESLKTLADDLLAERGSQDRLALRKRLQGAGVTLQDSHNYRLDFKQLQEWSATEIECQENQGRSKLIIGGKQLPITRPVVEVMLEAAKTQSFLVVGGAGTGKTGCLLTLANQLQNSGERVWYWAADSLPSHSLQNIRTDLNLHHSWMELFAEAASATGATLIVDGLDGLRDSRAMNAYQKLFSLAIQRGIKVIASIRYFDLQHSGTLPEIFPAVPETLSLEFRNKDFNKVNHFFIADLDDNELSEVVSYFPEIQTVLDRIPQLREVIRNLFSLDLLCKLIAEGESAVQLSGIYTQAELFERYWIQRVESHDRREEITEALELLIEQMVSQQTLQVVPKQKWTTELKGYLFSTEFIRHPHSLPGRLPESKRIEFNHHLLFDYLAERLFVRSRHENLANELTRPDTWGLFLRPSLVLFHRYTWNQGRLDFWDTLIHLERNSVSVIQKLPGYLVIAEEAICRDDLQPLLDGTIRNEQDKKHWKQIIQGVITAAQYSSLPRLFKLRSGDWWIELARDLIKTGNSQLVYVNQPILFSASNALETLSEPAKLLLNQAASALLQFSWNQGVPPSPFFRLPIECVCRTISSDISASSNIIRKIISYDELQRAGYIQIYEVVSHIEDIWKADPVLAREVYDAVFGYNETSQSSTAITPSQIFSLTSTRQQDYDLARHILTEKFPQFLSNHPTEATRALIRIIKHFYNQKENDALRFANDPIVEKARKRLEDKFLMDEDSQQYNEQVETQQNETERK